MAKLYEIVERYKNLEDLLNNDDIDSAIVDEALEEVVGEFEEKAENICKLMKNIESDIEGFKAEEKRLAIKRRVLESKYNHLKAYLDGTMKAIGVKKIKGNIFTLSIQKNPASVNIVDLKAIPKEYLIEQEPTVDKRLHTQRVYDIVTGLDGYECIKLKISWYEPNRRRDIDNITAGMKFILDGMVKASVIKDDSQRYVKGVEHEFYVDRVNPRVEVEIIEVK